MFLKHAYRPKPIREQKKTYKKHKLMLTFRLRRYESPSHLADDGDELLDIREAGLGDDLSQDEDGLEGSATRADNLSGVLGQSSAPLRLLRGRWTYLRRSLAARVSTAL